MTRIRMVTMFRVLYAVMLSGVLTNCSAGAGLTPAGRRMVGDISGIRTRVVNAYQDDLSLERELIDTLFAINQSTVKQRVLSDLDDLLSLSGEYDGGRLEEVLGDGKSGNVLVIEVRTGRMMLADAQQLLRDHAQSAGLSDKMRQTVEEEITARFSVMEVMKNKRVEILQAIGVKEEALVRMGGEMNAITDTLLFSRVGDGLTTSEREMLLGKQLKRATGLVGNEKVRRLLQAVIDAVNPVSTQANAEGGEQR